MKTSTIFSNELKEKTSKFTYGTRGEKKCNICKLVADKKSQNLLEDHLKKLLNLSVSSRKEKLTILPNWSQEKATKFCLLVALQNFKISDRLKKNAKFVNGSPEKSQRFGKLVAEKKGNSFPINKKTRNTPISCG